MFFASPIYLESLPLQHGAGCDRQPPAHAESRSEDQATLAYARSVADGFLDKIKAGQLAAASDLITKDFERRMRERLPGASSPLREVLIFPLVKFYKGEDRLVYENMAKWEIRSAKLAPDHHEVAYEGAFLMKDGKEFKFLLLVREEPDGGKWRVDAMGLTPLNEEGK